MAQQYIQAALFLLRQAVTILERAATTQQPAATPSATDAPTAPSSPETTPPVPSGGASTSTSRPVAPPVQVCPCEIVYATANNLEIVIPSEGRASGGRFHRRADCHSLRAAREVRALAICHARAHGLGPCKTCCSV